MAAGYRAHARQMNEAVPPEQYSEEQVDQLVR
jgi:hypothetical protein